MTQRCPLGFSSSGFASDAEAADRDKGRLGLLSECIYGSEGGWRMRHRRHSAVMCNMVAALAALGLALSAPSVLTQGKEVKVGLIAPLSGPGARQGGLRLKGGQMGSETVNHAG